MDPTSALEAVEAIRATVLEGDRADFDTELATRLGLVGEGAGAIAVDDAVEARPEPLDAKESILGQLETSTYAGYQSQVEQLNSGRNEEDQIDVADQATVTAEFEALFTDEHLAYVAEAMEADPELRFTLVATPNVTATAEEVIVDARAFGEDQPYATDVWSDVLMKYTPEEVSGTNPENGRSVRFSLVPNKLNPELSGKAKAQKAKLAELQADNPFLRDTSYLEDMARLHTLRAEGNKLVGVGTADLTYGRKFTMKPKPVDRSGDRFVPGLCVGDRGLVFVDSSDVGFGSYGRASVGLET